jgi:hypothetical protein
MVTGACSWGPKSSGDPRLTEDLRRRLGRALRQPRLATRQYARRRKALLGLGGDRQGLVGAEPARVFHDKTAIEADRTGGRCDGNVYFAWARFTGGKNSNIYLSRSVDHGATWSKPMNLTPSERNIQDPDISVTANGNVYVTYDVGAAQTGSRSASRS